MKDKILMLIIGILIGAVITAGCFLIFNKNSSSSTGNRGNFPSDMGNFVGGGPGGQMGNNIAGGTPPSAPTTSNTTSTSNSTNE